MAETVREADGLAMSSRNRRLNETSRKHAAEIFKVLKNAFGQLGQKPVSQIKTEAMNLLSAIPDAQPEYFEIADAGSLKLLSEIVPEQKVVICTAVWINGVRLIDCIFSE